MSLSLDILPLTESVDMYGIPDKSSAYSLSGHVAISLRTSNSLFERRCTTRLLLQSLQLTFEGQTEIIAPQMGYSALRLCSFTRELVTTGPIELTNEGEEDSVEPCVWNVVFSLAIPGWLPETTRMDFSELGVKYRLHATATFTLLGETNSSWFLSTLCTPFRARARYARTQKEIMIKRFIEDVPFGIRTSTYAIKTPVLHACKARTPPSVLEKIQVLVAVPHLTNMDDNGIPITVRMRTHDLQAAECNRLQVQEITADFVQKEKYRSRPFTAYANLFPLPPKERQPPKEPLLSPHPVDNVFEYGICGLGSRHNSMNRVTSFLPTGESGVHRFPEKNYAFADDAVAEAAPEWYTIDITLPFVAEKSDCDDQVWWSEKVALQPSMQTPLFYITHEVALTVTLSYDLGDNENRSYDRLSIRVPINLAHVLPTQPGPSPLSQSLPPYSKLYDEEGERKIDHSIPLPLYEPPSAPAITNEPDINEMVIKPVL